MKLQAKDFRVGNLLEFDGAVYEVTEIDQQGVRVKGDRVVIWIDLSEISPIQLTEEWLMRGGLEGDSITGAYVKYKLKSFEIWFDVAKNTFLLENIKNKKVYLPYVHNLQNAYHLIEGEEIEFNQTPTT